MIWLILAIASSAMVSVMMRMGEGKIQSNAAMFVTNYAVCLILSRLFMGSVNLFTSGQGISFALGLGLLSGVLYLGSFVLLQQNIRINGIVMASVFMKLGVLVPVLMAILVFHERPAVIQIVGIILAIAAILVVQLEKTDHESAAAAHTRGRILLLVLLLGGGITDSMANIYDKAGNAAYSDHYLFYTFLAALLCAVIYLAGELKTHGRSLRDIGTGSVLFGVLVGVPNYLSARFLLLALGEIPAVITYPVYSVVTMLTIGVIGVLCFGEKLGKRKVIAIGMVVAALTLLNQ